VRHFVHHQDITFKGDVMSWLAFANGKAVDGELAGCDAVGVDARAPQIRPDKEIVLAKRGDAYQAPRLTHIKLPGKVAGIRELVLRQLIPARQLSLLGRHFKIVLQEVQEPERQVAMASGNLGSPLPVGVRIVVIFSAERKPERTWVDVHIVLMVWNRSDRE